MPGQEEPETLLDIKYQSCQNFGNLKINKDKNKKFYETMNAKFNGLPQTQTQQQKKINNIVLSAYT